MHIITPEEFYNTRAYVERKALELMSHEDKPDIVAGVPINNYLVFPFSERKFYSVQVNTFMAVVNEHLHIAQNNNPEMFSTGDAYDVIRALHAIAGYESLEWFTKFLKHEKFTYVFESESGLIVDRILRIDLFRLIKPNESGGHDFIGGILHALKHFSRYGIGYSTGKSNHELTHPQELIAQIIEAFFILPGTFESEKEYVVIKEFDQNYNLKFVFYREKVTGVFFLNTVYKIPK